MSTFGELFEQAEQEIRAHRVRSCGVHFSFVVQGAVLLASIRLWGQLCGKTATDQRAMIEADKSSLEKVVKDLAEAADPEGVIVQPIARKRLSNGPRILRGRRYATGRPRAFADGKGRAPVD